jgi:[protein-PII] uridylyltransferase
VGTRERRDRSDQIDLELSSSFFSAASNFLGKSSSVALCAVGGYGRGELSPGSDLDLLILHDGTSKSERLGEFVNAFLYPLWSSGRAVDHSVRTRGETREIAAQDLRVAMGLLDIRFLAGNQDLFTEVESDSLQSWRRNTKRNFPQLRASIKERAERSGELAFLLEPDLKEARGGLRDINSLRAIEKSGAISLSLDRVAAAEALLSNVRDCLHSILSKPRDQLMLTEQDQVAELLKYSDADALMLDIAKAARSVDYVMDLTWHRLDQSGTKRLFKSKSSAQIAKGLVIVKGEVSIAPAFDITKDPEIGLRAAAAAAQRGLPLSIDACIAMAENFSNLPTPWPRQSREDLVSLIGAGKEMIRVFEALDQEELVEKWIPEWAHVRFLPQRNVLHHHTVDRHMLETAVHAAALTRTVKRPDLLLVAALLHDIGKGYPDKDHSEYGAELIAPLASRMGFSPEDISILELLVKEHLLLSTVATRRDLDDPQTIQFVVEKIKNPDVLQLLHALSISDGEATGRTAWSEWKANLVSTLVSKILAAMSGTKPVAEPELTLPTTLVGDFSLTMSNASGVIDIEIIARDQVGLLSVVAGIFTISRLEVRSARTKTIGDVAVMRWTVSPDPNAEVPTHEKLSELISKGIAGELDLARRIEDRVNSYRKYPGIPTPPPIVSAINDIATNATVIEVRMHDRPGVLFTVAKAISRFGVDIRSAIVSTLGAEAFDTIYVSDFAGNALTEGQAKLLANQVENILLTTN